MKSLIIRSLLIVLIFAVLIFGVLVWIGNTDQTQITTLGKEINLSSQSAFLGLVGYSAVIVLAWSFLKFLWDLPRRLKTGVSRRKQGQALEALEDAMIAASAGDADKARRKASRARNLINRPILGHIMSAQAAEVSGDPAEAEAQYKAMLDDDKTHGVGQRGLAGLAFARGDMSSAISYAEQAYGDSRNAKWAFDILFNAKVALGQWEAALETLSLGEKRKHISKEIAGRRRAVLMTAHADQLSDLGEEAALDSAVKAAGVDQAFAPATALAARLLVKQGEIGRAGKLIEKSWARDPHPALALAYRDLKSDETPKARAKRMKNLISKNPAHRESVLVSAEESLIAGDGVAAWTALAPLAKGDEPSARFCQLAAQAEAMCDNVSDARLWTERCASAPIEPDWSDLDPDGSAFDYTDNDWRRLVYSYGDKGELIHPRYENYAKMRPAGIGMPKLESVKSDAPLVKEKTVAEPEGDPKSQDIESVKNEADRVKAPSPDDPGSLTEKEGKRSFLPPF